MPTFRGGCAPMAVFTQLASLALKGTAAAMSGAGFTAGAKALEGVHGLLAQRFSDHSLKLAEALGRANDRAWRVVELALAGRSWWDTIKAGLAPGEDRAFRDQVNAFIAANPL